jgi:tetratricopeptide (TPR) repeat protein
MEYINSTKIPDSDVPLHQKRAKSIEADEYYQRAIAIRERFLGLDALLTADCLYQLADSFTEQGHLIHAHSLYQRALIIYEEYMSSGHQCSRRQLERYTALKEQLASSSILLI